MQPEVWMKDLEYELRLLFGAYFIEKLATQKVPGYLENYFKDSIYLHSRNLYNFFSNDSRNDAKVRQFTSQKFDVALYLKWKSALHTHVMHIKNERRLPSRQNMINGQHLNEQTQEFTEDIKRLWEEWISVTPKGRLKNKLRSTLKNAWDHAENDCREFEEKLAAE